MSTTTIDIEMGTQHAVRVSLAPPRRLMQDGRFRTFKTRDDRSVWATATTAVEELLSQGWQVVSVVIDWGSSTPLFAQDRERQARILTHCAPDVCTYAEAKNTPGRGWTTFTLERDA